jgi:adenylate kinase
MKNIIFIAPPAAGKGTISDILTEKYNYIHLSTGDLLRDVVKGNSELGKQIALLINNGQFVSDDIVMQLIDNRLSTIKNNERFILDGCPRNIKQIDLMIKTFNRLNINKYVVIYLNIDYDKAMKRTLGRLLCPNCKKGYNEFNDELKPKVKNVCDICGSTLIKRSDDTEATFKIRYDTYLKETKPVVDYFKAINKLEIIEADDKPQNIIKKIERIIEE